MLAAILVREITPGYLGGYISPKEGGLNNAHGGLTPAVVLGHGEYGDGDIYAVAIAYDEREKTKHDDAKSLGPRRGVDISEDGGAGKGG